MSKPKKMIAFILPNETGTKPLEDYTVSVDSVEKVTHIHFFPSLSDTLKSSFKINDWFK
jgi:endonuclease G